MRGSDKKYKNQRQRNKSKNLIILATVLGIIIITAIFFIRTGTKDLSDVQHLSLQESGESENMPLTLGVEEVGHIIQQYYSSLEKGTFNAHNFFNPQVTQYITLKNTSPVIINENYMKDKREYANPKFSIINDKVDFLKTQDEVDYYAYTIFYKCYRPSRGKYQECNVDVEIGLNKDGKIASYKELKISNLKFI
jgi:hypothetical protein